jgi:hypothetical protein
MSAIVILSVVINCLWILWLCLLDYRKVREPRLVVISTAR